MRMMRAGQGFRLGEGGQEAAHEQRPQLIIAGPDAGRGDEEGGAPGEHGGGVHHRVGPGEHPPGLSGAGTGSAGADEDAAGLPFLQHLLDRAVGVGGEAHHVVPGGGVVHQHFQEFEPAFGQGFAGEDDRLGAGLAPGVKDPAGFVHSV